MRPPFLAFLLLALATPAAAADLLVRGATVIDPVDGALGVRDVEIRGDRIARIAVPGDIDPSGHVVVDATGRFLVPGLWDMHGHVSDEASAPLYVLNGVTGVRQMFGHTPSYAWRQRRLEGTPAMPRMYLGSPLVDGAPAHVPGSIEVGDADAARAAVRTVKASGAQFLKVYSKLPAEAYVALMDEAARLGVRVEGHVPDAVSWSDVAAAGKQVSIEHLWGLPRSVAANTEDLSVRSAKFYEEVSWGGALTPEQQLKSIELQDEAYDNYDPARFRMLVADLATNRIWQTPTLVVWETRFREADPTNANDPRLAYVPAWMRDFWAGKVAVDGNGAPVAKALGERRHRFNLARLGEMHRAGVPILAGSDAPLPYVFPGWALHSELVLLVEAGLTPLEALRTATSNVGAFLERPDIGRIAEGAMADLVLLSADPTVDIANIGKIESVVVGGTLIDRAARDASFASLARTSVAPGVGPHMVTAYQEGGLQAAFAAFDQHCPAPVEKTNCAGADAVEYGLAPIVAEGGDAAQLAELVEWSEKAFSDAADVHLWAALQYRKAGDVPKALAALDRVLALTAGDPLAMHLQAEMREAPARD